jgi:hypothetical protein
MYECWKKRGALSSEWVAKTNTFLDHAFARYTTGIERFAECLKHSANPKKHSAKSLPSAALGKEGLANNTSAKASLPSTFYRALGKVFVECQTILGKENQPSRRGD